jgi:2-dehydro-3-deoxyphosphogluconate aldolase/(4S)-4-hydroxy-2-oxoglutarate aldolase
MNRTIQEIQHEKIIAIVRGVKEEKLIRLCQALYDGGIRLVECTYDASQTVSDEETAENIRQMAVEFDGMMTVGAGTVLTEKQVLLTKNAGGKFIISPDVNTDVIQTTKREGLVSIPGALTPSEITLAMRCGADFVKLFPASSLGGLDYIKAISAPLSHAKLLAVGGVRTDNLSAFLRAGFCGVGIGGGLVNQQMLENGDYRGITDLAKRFIQCAKES